MMFLTRDLVIVGFLFCSLMLFGTEQFEVETTKLGNTFAPGEKLYFVFNGFPQDAECKWTIMDSSKNILKRGKIILNEGHKKLEISPVKEWEGRLLSLSTARTNTIFTILPERKTAMGGDTRFGGWIGQNRPENVIKQAIRIGMSTAYPYWSINEEKLKNAKKYSLKVCTNLSIRPFNTWTEMKNSPTDLNNPDLFNVPRFDEWKKELAAYHTKNKGIIKAISSLCGEHWNITDQKGKNLRKLHRTFYDIVKKCDPNCKIALGMFMHYGTSALRDILAGTTPADFKFDYVSYDVCGIGDGLENFLKKDIQVMKHWGHVVPQWVCEIWGQGEEDKISAAELARIYISSLGLGVKELDWHSVWCATQIREQWVNIDSKKRHKALYPQFFQAMFRGSNIIPTQLAISHYQVWKNLSHARPVGELSKHFNIAAYNFRKEGKYIVGTWSRKFPVEAVFVTKAKNIEIQDHTGNTHYTVKPENGRITLKLDNNPYFITSCEPVEFESQKLLSGYYEGIK